MPKPLTEFKLCCGFSTFVPGLTSLSMAVLSRSRTLNEGIESHIRVRVVQPKSRNVRATHRAPFPRSNCSNKFHQQRQALCVSRLLMAMRA